MGNALIADYLLFSLRGDILGLKNSFLFHVGEGSEVRALLLRDH